MTMAPVSWLWLAVASCLLLVGCDPQPAPVMVAAAAQRREAPITGQGVGVAPDQRTIAYRHALTLEVEPKALEARWDRDRKSCADDKTFGCTVIEASFQSSGMGEGRPTARLVFRIAPEGVAEFAERIAAGVTLTARDTRATDMAATITDLTRRAEMLSTQRDRLLELEKRPSASIDDLVKISSELGRVQLQLEEIAGSRAKVAQQVEREEVSVLYQSTRGSVDRLGPINRALATFRQTLGESTGAAIHGVALALPWLPLAAILIALLYAVGRLLVRRRAGR
jgi:hypothetical protein